MTDGHPPLALLRNVPVRSIIRALTHEGFDFVGRKGSQRIYRHSGPPPRRVVVHYHTGNRPLSPVEIQSLYEGTHWTEDDLKRLGLTS